MKQAAGAGTHLEATGLVTAGGFPIQVSQSWMSVRKQKPDRRQSVPRRLLYDGLQIAVFQAVRGCLITSELAPLPWMGGFCGDDGNNRSFFTANLLMWNIMLLV